MLQVRAETHRVLHSSGTDLHCETPGNYSFCLSFLHGHQDLTGTVPKVCTEGNVLGDGKQSWVPWLIRVGISRVSSKKQEEGGVVLLFSVVTCFKNCELY